MTATTHRRAGMTLVELLIALTLLGIVGGAVIGVLVRQQRLSSRAAAVVDTRDQGRFALGTLAAELRGLSSIGGDIAVMSDTSLRIRTNVGTSVICEIGAGRTYFTIPPYSKVRLPSSGALVTLTSFVDANAPPTANDTAWVLNPSYPSQAPWDSLGVANPGVVSVSNGYGAGCPTGGTNFLSGGSFDDPSGSYRVHLNGPLHDSITVGAAVRFTRAVRYVFYQDTDNLWYLGYQNCAGAGCGVVQPVSGPFLPATGSAATTGFRFAYYDSLGAVTAVPRNVARIQIVTRALSRDSISTGSSRRTQFVQTDSINVALRNRT